MREVLRPDRHGRCYDSPMEWPAIIAGYAAIVATGNLLWTIYVGRRDAVHVHVEVSWASAPSNRGAVVTGMASGPYLAISVANTGRRPLTINDIGILGTQHDQRFSFSHPLVGDIPFELTEGQSKTFLMASQETVRGLLEHTKGKIPQKGYARDAAGHYHACNLPREVRDQLKLNLP